ncbi:MAG TPA: hypothetical protein VLB80_04475 [Candidatus Babeliales bacterium]|nr:hypothetical protein [Candidatus Babeliales bacterium]
MKKYIIMVFLLTLQNINGMRKEITPFVFSFDEEKLLTPLISQNVSFETIESILSKDNHDKALRLAKLFYKYPDGFKSKDYDKERIDNEIKCFISACSLQNLPVKTYLKRLKDIEAREFFCSVHDNIIIREIRKEIFTNLLLQHAQQYYAMSNMLKFYDMSGDSVRSTPYARSISEDFWKYLFLSELVPAGFDGSSYSLKQDNNKFNIIKKCTIRSEYVYYNKKTFVVLEKDGDDGNLYIHIYDENTKNLFEDLTFNFGKEKKRGVINFLNDYDTRAKSFYQLFNALVDNLSKKKKKNKAMKLFIESLVSVQGYKNKQVIFSSEFKGRSTTIRILLPLKEVLSVVKYDVKFFNSLAQSNDSTCLLIEFIPDLLQKWQDFPEDKRNILKSINIKIKDKGSTFVDKIIFHGPLFLNALMPEIRRYICDVAASSTGCNSSLVHILGIVGEFFVSYTIGTTIFPWLEDTFSSHVPSMQACISAEKVKKRGHQTLIFFITTIIHMMTSSLQNKFLTFQLVPIKIFAMLMYVGRVYIYNATYPLVDMWNLRNEQYFASDLKIS